MMTTPVIISTPVVIITLDGLGLPYRIFGHDSAMSEVINYAMAVNEWMIKEGRDQIARKLEGK